MRSLLCAISRVPTDRPVPAMAAISPAENPHCARVDELVFQAKDMVLR